MRVAVSCIPHFENRHRISDTHSFFLSVYPKTWLSFGEHSYSCKQRLRRSVLQCVAVCCSVLRCLAVHKSKHSYRREQRVRPTHRHASQFRNATPHFFNRVNNVGGWSLRWNPSTHSVHRDDLLWQKCDVKHSFLWHESFIVYQVHITIFYECANTFDLGLSSASTSKERLLGRKTVHVSGYVVLQGGNDA